jgi:MinD-like ATPase involved in chromosome partitioning or flagellar assembly
MRESAAARLVLRAYQPLDLEDRRDEIDVVVAGAETSWVTSAAVASWRRGGLRVVGVYPAADAPARRILETGGADEVVVETLPPEAKIAAIRAVAADGATEEPAKTGIFVAVTGSRGAPGRTEVALALAWNLRGHLKTLVLDADLEAPSLAIRLGIPARPDLADAADSCRVSGELSADVVHERDGLSFVVGSHRPGEPPLRQPLLDDVLDAALGRFDIVVADLGPQGGDVELLKRADAAVLVASGDAVGIVRAARTAEEWAGPPPALVLNRVNGRSARESTAAARQWLGLDPVAVIKEDRRIGVAAQSAQPPARTLRRQLERIGLGR